IYIKLHQVNMFFTFWQTKSKRLDLTFEPFKLKPKHVDYLPSPSPYENPRITDGGNYSDNIVAHDKRYKTQSCANYIKDEIYRVITSGMLNYIIEKDTKLIKIRFNWISSHIPKCEIQYK
ncbi:hypothetical protein V7156_24390, partial [Priestia megaterium]|uniref:hypothetical protein n=1 Tax=Priestia megaterium TaxID=1404 RepID=UPI0030095275